MASSSIKEMRKECFDLEDKMRMEYSRYNELVCEKRKIEVRLSCVKRCRSTLVEKYRQDKLDKLDKSELEDEIRTVSQELERFKCIIKESKERLLSCNRVLAGLRQRKRSHDIVKAESTDEVDILSLQIKLRKDKLGNKISLIEDLLAEIDEIKESLITEEKVLNEELQAYRSVNSNNQINLIKINLISSIFELERELADTEEFFVSRIDEIECQKSDISLLDMEILAIDRQKILVETYLTGDTYAKVEIDESNSYTMEDVIMK